MDKTCLSNNHCIVRFESRVAHRRWCLSWLWVLLLAQSGQAEWIPNYINQSLPGVHSYGSRPSHQKGVVQMSNETAICLSEWSWCTLSTRLGYGSVERGMCRLSWSRIESNWPIRGKSWRRLLNKGLPRVQIHAGHFHGDLANTWKCFSSSKWDHPDFAIRWHFYVLQHVTWRQTVPPYNHKQCFGCCQSQVCCRGQC